MCWTCTTNFKEMLIADVPSWSQPKEVRVDENYDLEVQFVVMYSRNSVQK